MSINENYSFRTTTIDALKREGIAAKLSGLSRSHCPCLAHQALRDAWLEGYDAVPDPEPLSKRFASGGPLVGGDV